MDANAAFEEPLAIVSDAENTVMFITRTLNELCVFTAPLFARRNENSVDPEQPLSDEDQQPGV